MPIKVAEAELTNGDCLLEYGSKRYQKFRILVRFHGQPLGWVMEENDGKNFVDHSRLVELVNEQLGDSFLLHFLRLKTIGKASAGYFPGITVVVCTRNRTDLLAICLKNLLALDYPSYEILVVDNSPSNDKTARLVKQFPVRYVSENRPGLDWARNRGIAEAMHDIVAFTDDDARPDKSWLRAVASAFVEPEVMAVTGPVLPVELETPAQKRFEITYGGMNHGFQRRTICGRDIQYEKCLWASSFGVGANMAFRRQLFVSVGNFDVALDVGTPSGGGGDVEMFHRLLAKGYTLVYEPLAMVWHHHRPNENDMVKLVQNNGRSFGCYLLTCARNRTVPRKIIILFALHSWLWGWIFRRMVHPKGFPRVLIWQELRCALRSPLDYLKSQKNARKIAVQFDSLEAVNFKK
jgi:glycosyltransferase involved in cell wall biosynthesis